MLSYDVREKIFVGRKRKKKTETNLEYRSELFKKICDFLIYSISKLHRKLNHKYIETEVIYYENEYKYI